MKPETQVVNMLVSPLLLEGRHFGYFVPANLYHATSSVYMESIMREGLITNYPEKQSALSSDAVFLTTNIEMAISMARSRAQARGGDPVVLSIDALQLNPDHIQFDMNMCGAHWTESIAYGAVISPEAIRIETIHQKNPDVRMLLTEPVPGERPLVFKRDWSRANEFLAQTQPGNEVKREYSRPRT